MALNMIINEMTQDEFKKSHDFKITYGIANTRFGQCLVGLHENQVCFLAFCDKGNEKVAVDGLNYDWPGCEIDRDDKKLKAIIDNIFQENGNSKPVKVLLRGTEFQISVWKELAKLDVGKTASYTSVAEGIGKPKAIRAVANAIAKNKVSYLIPCHRVIRKEGAPNKYRWGPQRKIDILEYEAKLL